MSRNSSKLPQWSVPLDKLKQPERRRAERFRALFDRAGMRLTEVEKRAKLAGIKLQRTNLSSAANQGKAQFKSAELIIGLSRILHLSPAALYRYLVTEDIDIDTLWATRDNAALLDRDASEVMRVATGTKGLLAYLDHPEEPVRISDVVALVDVIETRRALPYARPDGSHDYVQLFRDLKHGRLRPVPESMRRESGIVRARREQEEELGAPPPKKIRFAPEGE